MSSPEVYMRIRGSCVEKYYTSNSAKTESRDQDHVMIFYEMIGPGHDCM